MKHANPQLVRSDGPAILEIIADDPFFADVQAIRDSVARRAYELFQSDGHVQGHDLEHWLRAESQLLNPVPVELKETDQELIIHADVPGLREKDLTLRVEPHRLFVSGTREGCEEHKHGKTIHSELHSSQIFRTFNLPVEIEPHSVHARLRHGVLEVTMAKRAKGSRETKAA